jgi:hypothetical protein
MIGNGSIIWDRRRINCWTKFCYKSNSISIFCIKELIPIRRYSMDFSFLLLTDIGLIDVFLYECDIIKYLGPNFSMYVLKVAKSFFRMT